MPDGSGGRVWDVEICLSCNTHWSRDVNAARNIRSVMLYQNDHNGHRPPAFQPQSRVDIHRAAQVLHSIRPPVPDAASALLLLSSASP